MWESLEDPFNFLQQTGLILLPRPKVTVIDSFSCFVHRPAPLHHAVFFISSTCLFVACHSLLRHSLICFIIVFSLNLSIVPSPSSYYYSSKIETCFTDCFASENLFSDTRARGETEGKQGCVNTEMLTYSRNCLNLPTQCFLADTDNLEHTYRHRVTL